MANDLQLSFAVYFIINFLLLVCFNQLFFIIILLSVEIFSSCGW